MFKKLLITALAALTLTSIVACDGSSTEEKVDDGNDHIAQLNDIDTKLRYEGISVVTGYGLGSTTDFTKDEITKIKALLRNFIYHGNKVLEIGEDPNIILSGSGSIKSAISNAKYLLNKAGDYETREQRLARIQSDAARAKKEAELRAAKLREREAAELKARTTYNALAAEINLLEKSLKVNDIRLVSTRGLETSTDMINREKIKNMGLVSLKEVEADLAAINDASRDALVLSRSDLIYVAFTDKESLKAINDNSSLYLPIVRARIQGITKVEVEPTANTGETFAPAVVKESISA
ncbi:MAG: hypothetical protein KDD37_11180, partial [Bdellovibrionales bacterium]|nr:hypothetical protein [Bdellovibrionales bacterium]